MRLYYDAGTVHDDWDTSPAWGVQFVAWPDPIVGTDFCYGRSYFFRAPWLDGEPVSADLGGLYDFLRTTPLADIALRNIKPSDLIAVGVKFGRTISHRDFHDLLARVKAETEWTGQYPQRKAERVLV